MKETAKEAAWPKDRAIVLFDGVCNVCDRSVRFVLAHDPGGRFLFAPLQSEAGRSLRERFGLATQSLDTLVLVEGERTSLRSTAALRIVRGLGFPWSLFYLLVAIPRPLRDAAYDWFARNRYRWFGKRETCRLPEPWEKERFLA